MIWVKECMRAIKTIAWSGAAVWHEGMAKKQKPQYESGRKKKEEVGYKNGKSKGNVLFWHKSDNNLQVFVEEMQR